MVLVLAAVLAAAILALRSGGSRALGPDDYLYTRTAEWWLYVGYGPYPYVVRSIQEAWLARDGRGRSRYDVVGLSGVDVNRSLPFARSSDARSACSVGHATASGGTVWRSRSMSKTSNSR